MSLHRPQNPIVEECKRLRKSINPINERYRGLLDSSSESNNTLFPFVLLLGNHSSGKSSFINHLLQRKVQTTGVAPTDDSFTIIGPGDEDIDRNGPALVGDPDLGFSGLKMFGPTLVNHTQLKIRANTAIKDFMVVDSPGMIDSPIQKKSSSGAVSQISDEGKAETSWSKVGMDRGFDFEGVCRWYAERADVILLFFDPDKPGTTGETLSILTTSLVGLDHKMYIILNKADQFLKIHDFARAYGSLCWNISKVIPRKDLPPVYTMCIPLAGNGEVNPGMHDAIERAAHAAAKDREVHWKSMTNKRNDATKKMNFFDHGIHDLEESRAEVIHETLNAPRRRVDNEISRLTEAVSTLLMHCQIVDKVIATYQDKLWRARYISTLSMLCSVGLSLGVSYLCDIVMEADSSNKRKDDGSASSAPFRIFRSRRSSHTPSVDSTASVKSAVAPGLLSSLFGLQSKKSFVFVTALLGAITTSSLSAWEYMSLDFFLQSFSKKSSFEAIYQQLYYKALKIQDEFTIGMGRLVIRELPGNIDTSFISNASRVRESDFLALERILNEDITNLRREVSPSYPMVNNQASSGNATAGWYETARSTLHAQQESLSSLKVVQRWAAKLLGENSDAPHTTTMNGSQSEYTSPLKVPVVVPTATETTDAYRESSPSDLMEMDDTFGDDMNFSSSVNNHRNRRVKIGKHGAMKTWYHDSYHPAQSGGVSPTRTSLQSNSSYDADDVGSVNTRSTLSGMTSIEAFISASCGNPEEAHMK